MTPADIKQAIADGLADSLKQIDSRNGVDNAGMRDAFEAAFKPISDAVADMGQHMEKRRKQDREREEAENAKRAKDAADKLIADTIAARDAHWRDITACSPLIAKDELATLRSNDEATAKDYMAAALRPLLGDGAAGMDENILRGALLVATAQQGRDQRPESPHYPPGVGPEKNTAPMNPTYGSGQGRTHTATDAKSARDAYIEALSQGSRQEA